MGVGLVLILLLERGIYFVHSGKHGVGGIVSTFMNDDARHALTK